MTDTTPAPYLQFLAYQLPALEAGDYTIEATQSINSNNTTGQLPNNENSWTTQHNVSVRAPRWLLNPSDISAQFPKPGATGNFESILPHIMLKKGSLPWERPNAATIAPAEQNAYQARQPWLALLLFPEADTPIPKTITVNDLFADKLPANTYFPTMYKDVAGAKTPSDKAWLTLESGEQTSQQLSVIDVPYSTLSGLLPAADELSYLAHVRAGATGTSPSLIDSDDSAAIICNRLPITGGKNTLHLVSLEQRWDNDGTGDGTGFIYKADGTQAAATDNIRLVSLCHWQFYCNQHFKITPAIIDNTASNNKLDWLGTNTSYQTALSHYINQEFVCTTADFCSQIRTILGDPTTSTLPDTDLQALATGCKFTKTLSGLLNNLDQSQMQLRLPTQTGITNDTAKDLLNNGAIPLPHQFRNGDQSYSWYKGPLTPVVASFSQVIKAPIKSADSLLRYYPDVGMFDASYAAAWQLGRQLAIADNQFSRDLYHYKRYYSMANGKSAPADLADATGSSAPDYQQLQQNVLDWLVKLNSLQNIPFNYLVASEDMLIAESIRLFCVDPVWTSCLLDGALSIARSTNNDLANDTKIMSELLTAYNSTNGTSLSLSTSGFNFYPYLSGFLLRSEAVSGWAGLQAKAFGAFTTTSQVNTGTADTILKAVSNNGQAQLLSDFVMFGLFEGSSSYPKLELLEIYQKTEMIHFGFDNNNGVLSKTLKNSTTAAEDNSYTIATNANIATNTLVNNQDNSCIYNVDTPTAANYQVININNSSASNSFALAPKMIGPSGILASHASSLSYSASQFTQADANNDFPRASWAMQMIEGNIKMQFVYKAA